MIQLQNVLYFHVLYSLTVHYAAVILAATLTEFFLIFTIAAERDVEALQ